MRTFTVRQLDREPAHVLDTCDVEGAVQIRRRDGRSYTLAADEKKKTVINPPDIMARLRRTFGDTVISDKQAAFVDKLIAGE